MTPSYSDAGRSSPRRFSFCQSGDDGGGWSSVGEDGYRDDDAAPPARRPKPSGFGALGVEPESRAESRVARTVCRSSARPARDDELMAFPEARAAGSKVTRRRSSSGSTLRPARSARACPPRLRRRLALQEPRTERSEHVAPGRCRAPESTWQDRPRRLQDARSRGTTDRSRRPAAFSGRSASRSSPGSSRSAHRRSPA